MSNNVSAPLTSSSSSYSRDPAGRKKTKAQQPMIGRPITVVYCHTYSNTDLGLVFVTIALDALHACKKRCTAPDNRVPFQLLTVASKQQLSAIILSSKTLSPLPTQLKSKPFYVQAFKKMAIQQQLTIVHGVKGLPTEKGQREGVTHNRVADATMVVFSYDSCDTASSSRKNSINARNSPRGESAHTPTERYRRRSDCSSCPEPSAVSA